MDSAISVIHAAANTIGIAMAVLLAVTILFWIRNKRRPAAQRSNSKVYLGLTILFASLAFVSLIAPRAVGDFVIEPVGGVGIHTDSFNDYRKTTEFGSPAKGQDNTKAEAQPPTPRRNPPALTDVSPPSQSDSDIQQTTDPTWTGGSGPLASVVRTNRLIVHSASAHLVVEDVRDAINRIEHIATRYNGWTVTASQTGHHAGQVSIRVESSFLREALAETTSLAAKVESLKLKSDDVTDEFVDIQSRLKTLAATEQNYLALLEKAENITESLEVRELLLRVQAEAEQLKGRIQYLSQVANFSLIDVRLELAPTQIPVDAGSDLTVQMGHPVHLQATLQPPQGEFDYTYVWDMGDGRTFVDGYQTAIIAATDGNRITNPVSHTYSEERPYIVKLRLHGTGDAGTLRGEDTLTVTVKAVPSIDITLAEESIIAEQGDHVEIFANFTRPTELRQYRYQWYFGDGSPTESGNIPEGVAEIAVKHPYSHPTGRRSPHQGRLTLSALSDAGKVETVAPFSVYVQQSQSLFAGDWNVAKWAKSAGRAVFATLSVVLMMSVWLLVFSPLIGALAAVVYLARRRGWLGTPSQNPPGDEETEGETRPESETTTRA